jgi:ubiquinol-cytochrome c reductase iron-sulfur subunit
VRDAPGRLAFVLGAVRALRDRRDREPEAEDTETVDPSRREVGADPRAELAVVVLLVLAGLAAAAFAILVVADPQTQLLGATLAAGLACAAAALILAAKRIAPREVAVEEREPAGGEGGGLAADLRRGADGVTRRRALGAAGAIAGAGLAGALAIPVTALGPGLGDAPDDTPWHRGRRLVTTEGEPLRADAIEIGSFHSALPEGADKRELGSPVVVVRVDPASLRLPRERRSWAPLGILAFSQVCTHAGCAVTLFRYPVSERTSDAPALVCPCHYSTFDVRRAADPVFGPAARPLPQLPLALAPDGSLVATGPLSGSVGPSWWSVRR